MKRVFSAITQLSLRAKWVTIGLAVISLLAGTWAALQMNQELLPNIEFPQSFIFLQYGGASGEDVLALYTLPLETELIKVKGVVKQGLQSTTAGPIMFIQAVYEYGVNGETFKKDVEAAIGRVAAEGVPKGLKTTADLTPAIVTKVLTKAPSMWKHFTGQQLLAMSPDVLDAALKVNPKFADSIDPLTRDQLAAERIDVAANQTKLTKTAVALPGAWLVTDEKLPRVLSFNLSSLPVITASISSNKLNSDQLRQLVEKEMKVEVSKLAGVANFAVSGGQQIPEDVMKAADVILARKAQATPAPTASPSPTPAPATTITPTPAPGTPTPAATPAAPQLDANGIPVVSAAWRSPLTTTLLRPLIGTGINNAEDFFKGKDKDGKALTAAQTFNILAEKNANLLRDLPPAVLTYITGKEADFLKSLNDKAKFALSATAYAAISGEPVAPTLPSTWNTLADRAGYKAAQLDSVRDLLALPGGASAALNTIVKNTPAAFPNFTIKLISSLTPDMIAYLNTIDPTFLKTLDAGVLRYFSAEALKANVSYVEGLSDAALKSELQAIIADPTKSAIAQLKEDAPVVIPNDPTAPKLPEAWGSQLRAFGVVAVKADDLLRKPFGLSAGRFLNTLGERGGTNFMGPLSAEAILYVAARDPKFYSDISNATLGLLSKETLAKLPKEVAERAQAGPPFVATNTVTRVNGSPSLTVSISKGTGENTVRVSDAVEEYFAEFNKKHASDDIQISYVFEQASFIKESISGVAREGGLGAVMAVVVILIFLNFSFRSTLVTAVSIPTSIGIAFVFMLLLPRTFHPLIADSSLPDTIKTFLLRLFPASITLNIMTLSGLTVAIGRVVDDSIVVLENIYRKIQAKGDPRQAVIDGTRDVSLAIFAATVTTVVVFLPIGLSGGIIGEFFLPFGLAVTYSLLASFVVAITIVPLLAWMFIRTQDVPEEKEGRMEHAYGSALSWALKHRYPTLGVALVTLVIGVALFGTRPTTFLPSFGEPQIGVTVNMPSGTSLPETDILVRRFEEYVKKDLYDKKEIVRYSIGVGSGGGQTALLGGGGITPTAATISLVPEVSGEQLTELTRQVRVKAEEIFGKQNVRVSKASVSEQGFGGFALVASGDEKLLLDNDAEIIRTLLTVPGLTNVSSTISQTAGTGTVTYLRINQTAAIQYTGELETANTLGTIRAAITAVQANDKLPKSLVIGEGYQSQTQTQGFSQTFGSLGLAILIVYIVMVITFGSVIHPFTILFSLPLAVVGAALGLTLTNRVLGISALIGLLMLVGIVVTNAIVLIDRVQQNRKEKGMKAYDALLEGGRTRLRPILMTAIATIFALLPLAIGLSEGAIIAAELGTVVIGGLFSSTILTLLVVPVVYSLLSGLTDRITKRK
jgi:HAE1 family hydrophobic/amphiphilic exporter-1